MQGRSTKYGTKNKLKDGKMINSMLTLEDNSWLPLQTRLTLLTDL